MTIRVFACILTCLACLVFAVPVWAAEKEEEKRTDWEIHRSVTGIFDTKFPKNYKYNIFPFQFNEDTIAFSGEIVSLPDPEKPKSKQRSVLVKTVQTFGGELTYALAQEILERESVKYVESAKALQGTIMANEYIKHKGFLGKRLYITYQDGDQKQGLRIRIYVTNYAKVEQVLSAPADLLYAYRSDDFFNAFKMFDGITKKENPIGAGWVEHTSPNAVFTAMLPPQNRSYTPNLPKFSATPEKEVMRFNITDPVLDQDVLYRVYSYRINKDFTYEAVKSSLFANHLSKFVKKFSLDSLKTKNTVFEDTNIMQTKVVITPPPSHPYLNTIFLQAHYKGNTLVVQELLTSPRHARSDIQKTLFSQMKFHPEQYAPAGDKK